MSGSKNPLKSQEGSYVSLLIRPDDNMVFVNWTGYVEPNSAIEALQMMVEELQKYTGAPKGVLLQ